MIVRMNTGEDGQSHFEDITFSWSMDARGREETPVRRATGLEFALLPAGYTSEWHTASRHAYAIILAGRMECTVGDGTRQWLGPRDVLLAEDFTGQGHVNRVMDDHPLLACCPVAIQVAIRQAVVGMGVPLGTSSGPW
jgi:hypothetical protein